MPPLTPQEDEFLPISSNAQAGVSTNTTTPSMTLIVVAREQAETQEHSTQPQARSGTRVRRPPNRYEPGFT